MSIARKPLLLCLVAVTGAAGLHAAAPAKPAEPPINPSVYSRLRYRYVGPLGNRVIAVVGESGNPNVYYVGSASGGIFKTTDGGTHWNPIFDGQPASSVSALAIAPSDRNVVWAGTGETFIRSNISIGDGIYKSTDAGKTWKNVGLEKTGRIGRIVVDPHDPDVVFACALGHSYGPQAERGIYRTKDGGKAWERILFVDENTGCSDLAMDASNARVLFAGMWQLLIRTWKVDSGGPGSGVYVSRDGGDTWKRLTGHGLPDGPTGKIAVAVARRDPRRVYAQIETGDPGFYRSSDGGESWRLVNQDHTILERPHYYTRFAVAPDDENRIYFITVRFSMSLDGGETIARDPPRGGGDTHDMWIDPQDPDRMMVGDDGGVNISVNRGLSWHRSALPNAQMYHVATDRQIPYYLYGNRQDGYSYRGPSNSREGRIPISMWHAVGGCESGFAVPDPVDDNIVWSGCYDGGLERFDLRTRQARNVRVWPDAAYGWPPAEVKYRFQWTFPIAISPHDHNRVYVGSQYLHQTTDGGQSWTVISPDLTTNDKSKQQSSGGLVVDNLMVEEACVLFAIAESPRETGLIWVGTNDGLVQMTRDGGAHWMNVTANLPGLPPWGTVSSIEPSRFDAATAYISVDLHQQNNRDPFVYKTGDYGKTWRRISADIPRSVFSYVHIVREDPVRKGMLYAGTENGLYVSWDDGGHWLPLQNNLPRAPVSWIVIQEDFHDLVVSTYGRGFWILDDITPLRELSPAVQEAGAYLMPPRPAYRFRKIETTNCHPDGQADGEGPPYGADLNYHLKAESKEDVKIEISDESGRVVRALTGPKEAGLNRVWWDLRHEAPKRARLRTAPPGHSHVKVPADAFRPLVTWDLDISGGQMGPLVLPGTYAVKLTAGGQELTQKLTVKRDPHSAGNDDDIHAQGAMALELRDNIDAVVGLIDEMEWVRKQIEDLKRLLADRKEAEAVVAAAKDLERKAIEVEGNLYDLNLTGAREDAFRSPIRLYGKLCALASDVGANGADFAPTTQQREVHELFKKDLARYKGMVEEFASKDVAGFNALVREKGFGSVVARVP